MWLIHRGVVRNFCTWPSWPQSKDPIPARTEDGIRRLKGLSRARSFVSRRRVILRPKERLIGWDAFILDNWLAGNEGAGFAAREPNASCNFIGNRVEWNYGAGVEIRGGDHYVINSNFFDRQGGPGLDLRGRGGTPCSQITVNGNVFHRNGKPDRCSGKDFASSHIRCRQSRGLVISSNVCEVAQDDPNADSGDGLSPDYGIVCGQLTSAVIKDNVLDRGYLKEMIHDEGAHPGEVIFRDNIGSAWHD